MNYGLLYQWERLLSAHLPSLNRWRGVNSSAAYSAEGQVETIRALLETMQAGIGQRARVLVLAD